MDKFGNFEGGGNENNDFGVPDYKPESYIVGGHREESKKREMSDTESLKGMRERFSEIAELLDNAMLAPGKRAALLLEQQELARKIEGLEIKLIEKESPEKQLKYFENKREMIKGVLDRPQVEGGRLSGLLRLQEIEKRIRELERKLNT